MAQDRFTSPSHLRLEAERRGDDAAVAAIATTTARMIHQEPRNRMIVGMTESDESAKRHQADTAGVVAKATGVVGIVLRNGVDEALEQTPAEVVRDHVPGRPLVRSRDRSPDLDQGIVAVQVMVDRGAMIDHGHQALKGNEGQLFDPVHVPRLHRGIAVWVHGFAHARLWLLGIGIPIAYPQNAQDLRHGLVALDPVPVPVPVLVPSGEDS